MYWPDYMTEKSFFIIHCLVTTGFKIMIIDNALYLPYLLQYNACIQF